MVLRQHFIQLLLHISKKLPQKSRLLLDLVNVKLAHDLGQCLQKFTGVIQLRHIHTVQNRIGCLGDLLRHLCAKIHDGLRIIDLDGAHQIIHFLGVHQFRGHLLPVCYDIILLYNLNFILWLGCRRPNRSCNRCFAKIKSHINYPI